MEKLDLVFRMYKPDSEELLDYYNPIEMESREANQVVEKMISEAKDTAPDVDKQNVTLVPRKMDRDIKQIMKPKIDDLLGQTRKALISMKGH